MGGNRNPDGVRAEVATEAQLASYAAAEQQLAAFSAPVLLDLDRPEQRLFIASFDGTGNSKQDPGKMTNVALLDDQLREVAARYSDQLGYTPIEAGYVEGPGTQERWLSRTLDKATGASYQARLEDMYLQFVTRADRWLKEDPAADIRILVTGFSRGGEQAAGFTRMVETRGIQNPEGANVRRDQDGQIIGQAVYPQPPLQAPGRVIQSVVLFDPVGTGKPLEHDRRLAASVVSGFQITAADERRNPFPSTSIIDPGVTADGRFLNVVVAGAHSDIGGGYQRDGLAVQSGNLAIDYIAAQISPSPLEKRSIPHDPEAYVVHRSEQHLAGLYGTSKFERAGEREQIDLLAPPILCQLDCRDAMPRNEAMAASLTWQRVEIGPVPGNRASANDGVFVDRLLGAARDGDGASVLEIARERLQGPAGQRWLDSGRAGLAPHAFDPALRTPDPAQEMPAPQLER
ncbi:MULTISPECIES: T6SS phospholipase effector Tle1-like catalytic domain-containing protein [Luteimonas]|uniref:phospholipase effector Tle1 domain-containing protein n=1 Tax=Luteimonas TaxID=83614 RepID=UPI000C7D8265|nr:MULTISPECIES: DUF2235 domain-containing protein [Luteimonas]